MDTARGRSLAGIGPAALELGALTGAAIAQPLLDDFGRAPDVFIRAGAGTAEIVAFALVVALAPLVVLVAVEVLVAMALGERAHRVLHGLLVGTLATLLCIHIVRSVFGWQGVAVAVASCALAVAFVFVWSTWQALREWLRWAAVLPVVALVMFLAFSPVSDLVRGSAAHAAAHVQVTRRRSVIVLLLDEFPVLSLLDARGDIDAARYPNFARLARESTWFRNATSVGTHTYFAMPAIMTGQYPPTDSSASPLVTSYPDSIFRLLGGVYPVNAAEVVTRLCAPSYCRPPRPPAHVRTPRRPPNPDEGLAALFGDARDAYEHIVALHDTRRLAEGDMGEDVSAPSTTTTTLPIRPAPTASPGAFAPTKREAEAALAARFAQAQPGRFTAWLDAITPGDGPALHLTHLLLPHLPWRLTSSGRAYSPRNAGDLPGLHDGRWRTASGAELARRRHLMQVGYVDGLLGKLVEHLRREHLWDDSIVVVTADHGIGFTVHGHLRELDGVNRDEILGVPLFVHAPGMTPGIDDRPAETVDVVPTVADLLGVRVPWHLDGRSLARPATPRAAAHIVGIGGDRTFTFRRAPVDVSGHLGHVLALARTHAVPSAGTTDPDLAVLRTGPHGRVIGSRLSDFTTTGDPAGRRWEQVAPDRDAYAVTDPAHPLPALVVGHLVGGRGDDTVVGVVNGEIAGVGEIVEPGDRPLVDFILNPRAFRVGRNDVRFFLWRDGGNLAPF